MAALDADVVVIGAGISGLSSASLLQKAGLKVLVLEARGRVGGRTCTIKDPEHGLVDVGGAYLGPTQNRMYRVIKDLGLQVYDMKEDLKAVARLCGSWSTMKGTTDLPLKNPLSYLDLNNAFRTIDRMASQIPVEAPWKAAKAKEWDEMTVQQFINSLCWTRETKEMLKVFANTLYTCEAHEMSLLFFLAYIHTGQGIVRATSVTNGAQEKKIVGGSQQISDRMAEKLGGRVHLNSPVSSITQNEAKVTVTTAQGKTFTCKYVISAVPLPLLLRIQFSPPLPPHKAQLIQRVPMGSIIKINTFYKTAFWRDLGLTGLAFSDIGPISGCIDDTKPDGSHPAIVSFVPADQSREMAKLTPEERKLKVCETLAEIFRCKKFLEPIGYVEKNWMEEEYSGGCYSVNMPPGVLTRYGSEMRTPFGLVYFAGTETATSWVGYMEGAIEAGERAAREVMCASGMIPESEVWQEEPESLEYPAAPISQSWLEQNLPSVPGFLGFVGLLMLSILAFVLL